MLHILTDVEVKCQSLRIRDPDFFFLAIRLLDRFFRKHTALDKVESFLARIPGFTARNAEFVEWP